MMKKLIVKNGFNIAHKKYKLKLKEEFFMSNEDRVNLLVSAGVNARVAVEIADNSSIINKIYYDDNNIPYRVNKNLIPNNIYMLHGYKYETNNIGAILSAEANPLRPKKHKGRRSIKDTLDDIGRGSQKPGDNVGHIIGDQFGGFNRIGNLIPQNAVINGGTFKQLEDELANLIKEGKRIEFRIELQYSQISTFRPDFIIATYTIDGIESTNTFHNSQS